MKRKAFLLELPESGGTGTTALKCDRSVVIIGANGAGKTRLGTWIEFQSNQNKRVHRISAQKSLDMPKASADNLEKVKSDLYTNHRDSQHDESLSKPFEDNRMLKRWNLKPNNFVLNDFQKIIDYLFSERMSDYLRQTHSNPPALDPSSPIGDVDSKLNAVASIWESINSRREIKINFSEIQARSKDGSIEFYSSSDMSDGERVIFYFIAQALCAPPNWILVVDEPELHLHKSIRTRLWAEIQAARPDCLFIYLTHDVEFASALIGAEKIWVKSYDGQVWEWERIEKIEGFPEDLLIQVLGSRRPVLFVEGENESYDVALFRAIYPKYTVIPRSSCSQVILATRALRSATQFHHVEARGIIDRDRRNSEEIAKLSADGVDVLSVVEVEHLFCVPEVLNLIAELLEFNADEKLQQAKKLLFRELDKQLTAQISSHVAEEIKFRLNVFDTKQQGAANLKAELQHRADSINVDAIYAKVEEKFNAIKQSQDYIGALGLFNWKGAASQLSGIYEQKNLASLVIRLASGGKQQELMEALINYVPTLS